MCLGEQVDPVEYLEEIIEPKLPSILQVKQRGQRLIRSNYAHAGIKKKESEAVFQIPQKSKKKKKSHFWPQKSQNLRDIKDELLQCECKNKNIPEKAYNKTWF